MKTITCEEFKEKINHHENMTVLDVRSPAEFHVGHIEGALNLPLHVMHLTVEQHIPDKKSLIVCNCAVGGRSSMAVTTLQQMGYDNVYNLEGGYNAYCA